MGRRGRPITKPTTTSGKAGKRISFLLTDELYKPLAHHVIDIDTSIQQFVIDSILEKLTRDKRRR